MLYIYMYIIISNHLRAIHYVMTGVSYIVETVTYCKLYKDGHFSANFCMKLLAKQNVLRNFIHLMIGKDISISSRNLANVGMVGYMSAFD